jgi:hypothetical protein
MAGPKEDAETVTAFFEDMKRRGLNEPLLVTRTGRPASSTRLRFVFRGRRDPQDDLYRMLKKQPVKGSKKKALRSRFP